PDDVAAASAVVEESSDGGRQLGIDGDTGVLGQGEVTSEYGRVLGHVLDGDRDIERAFLSEPDETGDIEPHRAIEDRQRGVAVDPWEASAEGERGCRHDGWPCRW